MSKFKVVDETPAELNKGEYLIDKPSFIREIQLHKTKKPRDGHTGLHYIRMVTDSIAQAYDPENMSTYAIKAHNYDGLLIPNDEVMNEIMVRALHADYPAIFPKYLDAKIRNRPANTELVIYVNSDIKGQYEIFYRNGFAEVEDEVEVPKKSGKIVGKPAVTSEQAKAMKESSTKTE